MAIYLIAIVLKPREYSNGDYKYLVLGSSSPQGSSQNSARSAFYSHRVRKVAVAVVVVGGLMSILKTILPHVSG